MLCMIQYRHLMESFGNALKKCYFFVSGAQFLSSGSVHLYLIYEITLSVTLVTGLNKIYIIIRLKYELNNSI